MLIFSLEAGAPSQAVDTAWLHRWFHGSTKTLDFVPDHFVDG